MERLDRDLQNQLTHEESRRVKAEEELDWRLRQWETMSEAVKKVEDGVIHCVHHVDSQRCDQRMYGNDEKCQSTFT